MGKIEFHSNDRPTIGVELELGLIDRDTMALSSSINEVLSRIPDDLAPFCKPELMQSVLEINHYKNS